MPRRTEDILEFDRLRELVAVEATCAAGRRAVRALAFRTARAELVQEFSAVTEAVAFLRSGQDIGFASLADPQSWLTLMAIPAALTPADLLDAATLVDASASLREMFRDTGEEFPLLTARARAVSDLRYLAVAIRRAILPNGDVSDDASAELRRIRTGIGRTRDTIQRTLERLLRAHSYASGGDYITRRNDRYVIPVRASEKRDIGGVVHAASATGQTVFVEPVETIELNNRLVQLAEEEAAEVARILEELTARLKAEERPLTHATETIAEVDSLFARARFAREFDACTPEFANTVGFTLEAARHPVLESGLKPQGKVVVPLSLSLGGAETMLVISGPNTGGKTVALKTVGLAVLAAQAGIPVPAQAARLAIFDRVLADIGDEQSIAANLSTFSAHVLNLKSMLEAVTENSLVLVDEIGTGTAPEEGAALAMGLLDEFRARGCMVLATTHHDRLKAYASTTPGVINAAVEFDETRLAPTYRLRVGVPGGSSGIAIAKRLGLPESVINKASALITPESREASALISHLHQSQDEIDRMRRDLAEEARQIEQERRTLQNEWTERQKRRIAELEKRFEQAIADHEREMGRLIEGIKEREARAQAEKQSRRKLTEARADARAEADVAVVAHLSESQADLGLASATLAPPSPVELVPGVRVRVRGFSSPVLLRRRDDVSAEVEAGPLRMKVPLGEIIGIAGEQKAKSTVSVGDARAASRGVAVRATPENREVGDSDEINVIGCTVEEASDRVDKFLDRAALEGKPQVRIIHGHGTGALRRGLAEFLGEHPLVERIHAEVRERGGTAVTVVELKS